jgi:serine/threonine-protein kinase
MDLRLSDPQLVGRFEAERQILARLEHPALTRLLDGGVTQLGEPYLVMEYVEGGPIDAYCDDRCLGIADRVALFIQVCHAVAYAHNNLVLHRDLKPSNILVSRDGRPKVVDFGTAAVLQPDRLATTSSAPLTPAYASPEQLTGGAVGTASDQYSLGLVLYQLLTGVSPFGDRPSLMSAIERALSGTTTTAPHTVVTEATAQLRSTSTQRLRRLLSSDLGTILGKALAPEAAARYVSVQHLADDLERWQRGEPVVARPASVGYRLQRFVARHLLETAAVALAIVGLVGGLIAATVQARRAEAQSRRATEVTRFLTSMLTSADPDAMGKDVTVRAVIDQAVMDARALESTPEVASEIRAAIGRTLTSLGDYEAAEQQLRLALAAEKRAKPGGSVEEARLLVWVSFAQESDGRLDEARDTLAQAETVLARHPDDDPEGQSAYLDQHGRVLAGSGEHAAAAEVFERQRSLIRAHALGPRQLASSLGNLAQVRAMLGQIDQSVALYEEALSLTRDAYGRESGKVAEMLSPYASALWFVGERERSLGVYEESLRIRRTLHGPTHPGYAQTLANYADSLVTLGRHAQAEPLVREVLALRGTTLDDSHPMVAFSMQLLGRILGPLGRLEEGERWLRESLALRTRVMPPGHWTLASSRSALGEHMVLARRFAEAESLLLGAEAELVAALGDASPIVEPTRRRLVALYTAWERPEDAQKWQARLPAEPSTP